MAPENPKPRSLVLGRDGGGTAALGAERVRLMQGGMLWPQEVLEPWTCAAR